VSPSRRGAVAVVASAAGLALGLGAASSWNPGVDPRIVTTDLFVGWTFIGGGIAVWALRPRNASGRLLAAVGVAWFAGTMWPSLEFLHRGPLLHLVATYPAGRLAWRTSLAGRLPTAAVLTVYAANVTRLGDAPAVAMSYGALLVFVATGALASTSGTLRRIRLVGTMGGMAIGVVVLAASIARLAGAPLGVIGLYAYEAVLGLAGLAMTLDLLIGRWSQAAVARAVVDLGDAASAGSIRDRLARSLGDSSLVVAYALDDEPGFFVDELGRPVLVPSPSADRTVVPMVVAGREVGFIAGEAAVLEDRRLIEPLSAVAALARSNSVLQAQTRARVAEVAASRERLVHAADAERRRLERRLRSGAAQHLKRVAEILERVELPATTADACRVDLRDDLVRAQSELEDFARGIHPASLTDAGLSAALADLVRRTPVTAELDVAVDSADPVTEATIYFICSEAITNAAKHASARRISIEVRQANGTIRLVITDDGCGGAQLTPRGGLRGLADRVEALGGTFELRSESGLGTTIRSELVASP
jgi:signal transduction histidine kinase